MTLDIFWATMLQALLAIMILGPAMLFFYAWMMRIKINAIRSLIIEMAKAIAKACETVIHDGNRTKNAD